MGDRKAVSFHCQIAAMQTLVWHKVVQTNACSKRHSAEQQLLSAHSLLQQLHGTGTMYRPADSAPGASASMLLCLLWDRDNQACMIWLQHNTITSKA